MDFTFTRMCDQHPIGNRVEGGLLVSVVSPLNDDYSFYTDEKCKLESIGDGGHLILRLANEDALGRELLTYKRTDKFLANKNDGTLNESTKRILRTFAEENRERRTRLVNLLGEMLVSAGYFVAGQSVVPKSSSASGALDEALEYLVKNSFTKMSLLKHLHDEPLKEIQAVLKTNDIGQLQLGLKSEDGNAQALAEVRNYVELASKTSKQVVLYEMLDGRFASRPYGWPPLESALLVAQLLALGEISIVIDSNSIPAEKAYEPLSTTSKWRKITILLRRTTPPADIQQARNTGKQVFSEMGPDGEDALFDFLKGKAREWMSSLASYKALADTGSYPGSQEISDGLALVKPLVAEDDTFKFIERFNTLKSDLLDLSDDFHDLQNFYEQQKPTWEKLRKAHERFQLNRMELERDAKAAPALKRMAEILSAPAPYPLVKEADGLIQTVETINKALVDQRRGEASAKVEKNLTAVKQELDSAKADAALRTTCLSPIEKLSQQVAQTGILAQIAQAEGEAVRLFDSAVAGIHEWLEAQQAKAKTDKTDPTPKPAVKALQVVKPADLVTQTYLESEDDVKAFIDKLQKALMAAVSEKKRIQIR